MPAEITDARGSLGSFLVDERFNPLRFSVRVSRAIPGWSTYGDGSSYMYSSPIEKTRLEIDSKSSALIAVSD